MAFNGSGTFNRIHSWAQDLANGINITASRMDSEQNGIATGLSNCITKDGQTTVTGNIPFNGSRLLTLGDATAHTDASNAGQIQDSAFLYAADTGAADAYVITLAPAPTAYVAGQDFTFLATNVNTTTSTLNVNSLGVKTIKRQDGSNLTGGDIKASGITKVVYDGTNFQLISQIGGSVGGGDLLAANNLSDVSSAATSRTNLGLAIGTDVQAEDADLTTIAGLTQVNSGVMISNGTTWAIQSGATLRTSLGLGIGADVQAWDAQLDDLAGLSVAANNFIVADGANWAAKTLAQTRTVLDSPQLGAANTFSGDNIFSGDNALTGQNTITRSASGSGARALRLHHTGTGTEPPTSTGQGLLEVYLQSTTTSTPLRALTMFNDDNTTGVEYGITWDQDNSVGTITKMAEIVYSASDLTDGSEDGTINLSTTRSGTFLSRARIRSGMTIGVPTGGDQGAGTLNAVGVYDDGSLLTCYPIEYEKTGAIDVAAWDGFAQDRRDDKGKVVEVAAHTPARTFASRPDLADLFDPDKFYAKMIAEERLPSMPTKAEWSAKPLSIGSISQRLWETAELQAVHIKRLSDRLAVVEAV